VVGKLDMFILYVKPIRYNNFSSALFLYTVVALHHGAVHQRTPDLGAAGSQFDKLNASLVVL
jgi:hypothetical protein